MTILPQLKQDVLEAAAAHRLTADPVHDQGPGGMRQTARLRPRATILTAGAAVIAAAAAALVLLLGAATSPLPAYALVRNQDGTVTVTLHDLATAIAPVNAKFAQLGIDETVIPITDNCATKAIAMVGVSGGPAQAITLTAGRRYLLPGWHGILVAKQNPGGHVALILGAVQGQLPSCWPTHAPRTSTQTAGRAREALLLTEQTLRAFRPDARVTGAAIRPTSPVQSFLAAPAIEPVDATLLAGFALLRDASTQAASQPADSSDQAALETAVALDDSPPPPGIIPFHNVHGLDLLRAGETTVGPGHAPVWLVPGSNGACLVNLEDRAEGEIAGSVCNTTGSVDAGYLWTNDWVPSYSPDKSGARVLIGVAPDGNSSVTINWTGGGSTVLPVTDNVYSVPLGGHSGWTSVTLRDSSGQTVTVPGMPQLP
jgi:hypothetical protein